MGNRGVMWWYNAPNKYDDSAKPGDEKKATIERKFWIYYWMGGRGTE